MRGGEGFVQVHVDGVKAHVTGPADAHEGVQVGAVVVEHRAGGMHKFRNIQYLVLKQPQGVGVCHHQGGDPWGQLRFEVGEADAAVRAGFDLNDVKPAEGRAGGVGAVGRVGDKDLGPGFPS
jgi:hypothetical protein